MKLMTSLTTHVYISIPSYEDTFYLTSQHSMAVDPELCLRTHF